MNMKNKNSFGKSWYIINWILSTLNFSFFFFSQKLKEIRLLQSLIKFGNKFHRFYIFSKIVPDSHSLSQKKFSSWLIIFLLKFSSQANRKIFWKIVKFRFFVFFSKRPSLLILDFYYQSICSIKKNRFFRSMTVFPFPVKFFLKKKDKIKYRGSLRCFISGFSIKIKTKIKKFQSYFVNFFFRIPFIVSSRLGQDIFWEYLRIKKKKNIKKISKKFFKILHYMLRSKKNYLIIFKIIISSCPKKFFSYFNNLNETKKKNLKTLFGIILSFIILIKNSFKKKSYVFCYKNFISKKSKQSYVQNSHYFLRNFLTKFLEKENFFIFFIKFFDINKIIHKKIENKKLTNQTIGFLIKKISNIKMLNFILKNCFFDVELKIIEKTKCKVLDRLGFFDIEFFLKKNKMKRKKNENFFFQFFLGFYDSNVNKSRFRLFFCQLLSKNFLNFKKKNIKAIYFKQNFYQKILMIYKFKIFSQSLKNIKFPLLLNKKYNFNLNREILLLERQF
ncbi:hypothetical protein CMESO_318 (nucleomorph) [Chroomonas mesostigmatica CCMP1168]|uniref:Uncharacterized protein n=1 Tax=Chroomonas mesostigmatica CCMP1168 TaxID=1195612 RepID=J7G5Z2_9CRYP|nr:hypothetical protein CMESO_318 [Chroomonas mesostigmatica CCMP1168]